MHIALLASLAVLCNVQMVAVKIQAFGTMLAQTSTNQLKSALTFWWLPRHRVYKVVLGGVQTVAVKMLGGQQDHAAQVKFCREVAILRSCR